MTEQDLKIFFADLKDKLEGMDVYTFISYAKKREYELIAMLFNDNQTGIDVDTLGRGKIIDYLIMDDRFKSELGEKIIEEASERNTWGYFRDLLNGNLEVDTLLKIFRDDNLEKASADRNIMYVLLAAMTENNPKKVLEFALENDTFYKHYKERSKDFSSLLVNLDYGIVRKFIDKDIDFVTDSITLTRENYEDIIHDETINNETLYAIVKRSTIVDVTSEFFHNDPRRNEIFNRLTVGETRRLLDKKVSFGLDLLDSDKVFDALKTTNIVDFRANINRFEEDNPSIDMEEKVEKYYESILSTYNPETKMLKAYEEMYESIRDKGFIDELTIERNGILMDDELMNCRTLEDFQRLSDKKIREIVTDFLFKDNKYNVNLNMKELDRYEDENTPINIERQDRLKTIITKIKEDDPEHVIMLFNRMKDGNVHELYYDAIRETKEVVNQTIKDSSVLLDKGLTILSGRPVYDMRDKEFYMLARVMGTPYREETMNERDCYSLISNENTTLLGDEETTFIYGYEDYDPRRILHIFEGDAFSVNSGDNTTKYVNRLMTPRDIVTLNGSFSEIQYKNEEIGDHRYRTLKPSYIIAVDKISDRVIKESERLNIPIRLIRKKTLGDVEIVSLHDSNSTYVSSSNDEYSRKK